MSGGTDIFGIFISLLIGASPTAAGAPAEIPPPCVNPAWDTQVQELTDMLADEPSDEAAALRLQLLQAGFAPQPSAATTDTEPDPDPEEDTDAGTDSEGDTSDDPAAENDTEQNDAGENNAETAGENDPDPADPTNDDDNPSGRTEPAEDRGTETGAEPDWEALFSDLVEQLRATDDPAAETLLDELSAAQVITETDATSPPTNSSDDESPDVDTDERDTTEDREPPVRRTDDPTRTPTPTDTDQVEDDSTSDDSTSDDMTSCTEQDPADTMNEPRESDDEPGRNTPEQDCLDTTTTDVPAPDTTADVDSGWQQTAHELARQVQDSTDPRAVVLSEALAETGFATTPADEPWEQIARELAVALDDSDDPRAAQLADDLAAAGITENDTPATTEPETETRDQEPAATDPQECDQDAPPTAPRAPLDLDLDDAEITHPITRVPIEPDQRPSTTPGTP